MMDDQGHHVRAGPAASSPGCCIIRPMRSICRHVLSGKRPRPGPGGGFGGGVSRAVNRRRAWDGP